MTTAAVTLSLWGGPSLVAEHTHNSMPSSFVASAVEKASGTGSRVNKDAESLLRLGLPIQNKEVRKERIMILMMEPFMIHGKNLLVVCLSNHPFFF